MCLTTVNKASCQSGYGYLQRRRRGFTASRLHAKYGRLLWRKDLLGLRKCAVVSKGVPENFAPWTTAGFFPRGECLGNLSFSQNGWCTWNKKSGNSTQVKSGISGGVQDAHFLGKRGWKISAVRVRVRNFSGTALNSEIHHTV